MSARVLVGDCLEIMPTLDAASFDAIVTDPPYGIRFMGKAWDGAAIEAQAQRRAGQKQPLDKNGNARKSPRLSRAEAAGTYDFSLRGNAAFQAWCEHWAGESIRLAKPGAHLVAFGGTRTYHRLTCAIEDAGWEIRDCLMWLYGSGFPKSHNGEWGGTALKPAWEPIILARKPLAGTVAANHAQHGTGALNIDACRIGADTSRGERYRGAPPGGGGTVCSGGVAREVWSVPAGRWPANVVLDENAAAMLDEQTGELASGTAVGGLHRRSNKTANCYGAFVGQRTEGDVCYGDAGGASRFFYTSKASRAERNAGLEGWDESRVRQSGHADERVWDIPGSHAKRRANHHPTVKPLDLMRWLVRLITPAGGIILDPFTGSGTTGCAALAEGRRFIGIEREPEYTAIAEARLNATQPALDLGRPA